MDNPSTHQPPYDLVVMGATGFVGKILCHYLLECHAAHPSFTWAIAARSAAKLEKLRAQLGEQAAHLPSFALDITDEAALRSLCSQTQVILSTVGPYALYGEPLVKVCAETGTDYCDLTGEVQWIRRMIQTYSNLAEQSGARLVHCCGFDSIPSDLGVYFLQQQSQQQFGEPCLRIKMRVKGSRGGVSRGTIASVINLVKEAIANPETRQTLTNPYCLCPESSVPAAIEGISTQVPVQYDPAFQEWIAPFVMAEVNTRIVLRSNALLDKAYGATFYYDEAVLTGPDWRGWTIAQMLKLGLEGFTLASAVAPARWILENTLPKPGEGPSPQVQAEGFYDLRFWGQTASGAELQVKVRGDRDPGYGSTAKMLGQAGLCLAQDLPKGERGGGFWTPASLLGHRLIERLVNFAGISFEVLA